MIAGLRGTVVAVGAETATVEVGGVALAVQCTPRTLAALTAGEQARLSTSLVVREDSLTLFGFLDDDERGIFETLQTVTGVGPRLAQAVLAVHAPSAVRLAVATDDIGALTLVPGVGRKGAQRMLLELKDKLGAPATVSLPGGTTATAAPLWREQLRTALTGLGWSGREVDEALAHVGPEAEAAAAVGDEPDVGVLLKRCLQSLSRA